MPVIAERTRARHRALATARGGSGDPSPFTALGVEAAIRRRCERLFGDASTCRAASIAVIGLGHVGAPARAALRARAARARRRRRRPGKRELARRARRPLDDAGRGADRRRRRARPVRARRRARRRDRPRLRCRVVAGAANNQLADDARRRRCWPSAGSCGRPTSSSTPAASSTSPSSCARGYDAARAAAAVRAIGDTLTRLLDRRRRGRRHDPAQRREARSPSAGSRSLASAARATGHCRL